MDIITILAISQQFSYAYLIFDQENMIFVCFT